MFGPLYAAHTQGGNAFKWHIISLLEVELALIIN